MQVGDVVKSNLPFSNNKHLGLIIKITQIAGGKTAAEVFWDDNCIRGTMTKYLEAVSDRDWETAN